MDRVEALTEAIVEMDEELALALVRELTDAGASRSAILQAANAALQTVGERYERKEYFLSALIVGGDIFKQVVEVLGPETRRNPKDAVAGEVLLGNGRRRSPRHRQEYGGHSSHRPRLRRARHRRRHSRAPVRRGSVREYEPDILGLSGILIPIAATAMRKTVEAVRADRAEAGEMPVRDHRRACGPGDRRLRAVRLVDDRRDGRGEDLSTIHGGEEDHDGPSPGRR